MKILMTCPQHESGVALRRARELPKPDPCLIEQARWNLVPAGAGCPQRRLDSARGAFYPVTKHDSSRQQGGCSTHYHPNQSLALIEQGARLPNQRARSYLVWRPCLVRTGRRPQYKRPPPTSRKVCCSLPINPITIQVYPPTWPSEHFPRTPPGERLTVLPYCGLAGSPE